MGVTAAMREAKLHGHSVVRASAGFSLHPGMAARQLIVPMHTEKYYYFCNIKSRFAQTPSI